ncbi:DUF4347 domain-containing protein [Nodularia spumigena]|uniref:DUF4347 domain-containing protein n=1 Tax=Nodularia spumigena TaxID=70799 RepID=UPI001F15D902|nr:DUF4347 domain-containing protein [Nodularia spumigena]
MSNNYFFSKTDTDTVVFIDSSVPNYKRLQEGVLEGVKTFILSPNRDGIEEITEVLQQNSQITRLHIVSHGSPEYLYLGNTQLSLENLHNYQSLTRTWNVESILLHNSNSSLNARDSTSDRIAYVGLIGNPTNTNKINLSDSFVTTATPEARSAAFPEVNQTDTSSSKFAPGNNVTEQEITSVQPNINEGVDPVIPTAHPRILGCSCSSCARPLVDRNQINNPPQELTAPVSAALDLSQTFFLNSLAGANHTIYLDFNGHTTSGTFWNESYGTNIVTPAFDLDGNTASFSSTELQRIQYIWQRVAEDFIPFNVNVTTQAPTDINDLIKSGANDTRWGVRAVIGGSGLDWIGQRLSGIAYLNSFNWGTDTPTFMFSKDMGGQEKPIAETISHEVGHTLGLKHDGTINPREEYYYGHGSGETGWAPIMGYSDFQNVTQWTKGEYASATNTEDDLQIITTKNGFGYRTDDTGNTIATAKALNVSGTTLNGSGIIERNTDIDYYSFFTGAGAISLTVNPFTRGPNLDILAELYDSVGTLIVSSNPTESLFASIDTSVAAGTYYLKIDGVGKGDPFTTGYTDYGSLGQYTISGNIAASNITPTITLAISPDSVTEDGTTNLVYTFTRTENTTNALTVNYSVAGTATFNNDYSQIGAASFTDTTGTITFAANSATATLTIDPTADTIVEDDETVALTLNSGTGYTVATATAVTGTITNDDFLNEPPRVILNINGNSNEYALSAASQNVTNEFTISADKTELGLSGNTWKKLDIGSYNITNNTILEFEFQSSKRGEIHGIGFDTDNDVVNNPQNLFQLSGTQNWGLNNFKNYSTGSGWQSYSITVGDYFTGDFNYLTFANDHDVASPDSNGQFRNIQLYENQNNISVNINGNSNEYALSAASQNVTNEFTISADKTELGLSGNTWKKLDIGSYNITNNTILEFEFQSSKRGEIHGIGFDTDNDVVNNPQNLFQLSGTQNWGLNNFKNYSTGSGWQSYSITVGDYFTGDFNYLTFANDHDVLNPDSNGQFRNIQLYENQNNISVNINGNSNEYALSAASQNVTNEFTISADKTELGLSGNTWKKLDIGNYNITNNTILEFEFQSSKRGEIHGIGFDTDNDVVNNPQNLFQLSGTQNWGLNNFKNYSTGSGWQSYSITVGDYFTGNFNYLTFANDHDVASPDSNGQFRNIQLYENQNVSVNINGSSNEYALSAASQNVTNEFTISADKTELGLSGNTWKKLDIGSYNITNNTILEFEFQSSKRGEIHGIGFDTDNDVVNNPQNLFQLSGTQNWGLNNFKNYSTGSGWQSYSITVGDYFTGDFNYLTFANDHDVLNPDSNGQFRNIQLYENQNNISVNINGNSNEYALSAASQNVTNEFTISADKTELGLSGNTWKKLDIGSYNITNNTILEFEFQSSKRGEIHGIGFDTDNDVINNPQNLFQLSGTQNWGLDDFKNYSTGSGWQSYGIKVGDYFTGNFNYLTFANDHDVLNPDSNGQFRNIQLNEAL